MKTKIYLAKSNRANPNDVARVRQTLEKYSNDIEILEYKGGNYSHKEVVSADILIVVPDLSEYDVEDYDDGDNYIDIGKGLHEQIENFKYTHKNSSDCLVVYGVTDYHIYTSRVTDLDVADCDDYINYSTLIFDSNFSIDLSHLLESRFNASSVKSTGLSSNSNEYMYVLIGK